MRHVLVNFAPGAKSEPSGTVTSVTNSAWSVSGPVGVAVESDVVGEAVMAADSVALETGGVFPITCVGGTFVVGENVFVG
jgi:hypothetical protein